MAATTRWLRRSRARVRVRERVCVCVLAGRHALLFETKLRLIPFFLTSKKQTLRLADAGLAARYFFFRLTGARPVFPITH